MKSRFWALICSLILIFSLTSCSATELINIYKWKQAGFSLEEAGEWDKAGFTLEKAGKWHNIGFATPDEASPWSKHFSSPQNAIEWRDAGFSDPDVAHKWIQKGLDTPKKVQGFENIIKARLIELLEFNIDPEVALLAAMLGINKEIYNRWAQVSPKIQELIEYKIGGIKIEEAIEWHRLGFTANEAYQWKHINLEKIIGNWWYKIELNSKYIAVPPLFAKQCKKAQITPYWGALYYATGHTISDTIRQYKKWETECNGVGESLTKLTKNSGTEGVCYHVISTIFQWISPKETIIFLDWGDKNKSFYLFYPDGNAPENGFYGILKKEGTISYKNLLGKTVRAPKLKVITTFYSQ